VPGGEGVLDRSRVRARRRPGRVWGGAHGVQQVVRVDAGLGAAGGGAGQRAAEVPDLDAGQRRLGLRSCCRDQDVDRGGGEVGQRLERAGAVAGALWGDPDPAGAGVPDRLGHVGGRPGLHDHGGPLVHGQVPRLARLVVADLARLEYLARDSRPQSFQAATGNGVRSVHCFPCPSEDGERGCWSKRSFLASGVTGLHTIGVVRRPAGGARCRERGALTGTSRRSVHGARAVPVRRQRGHRVLGDGAYLAPAGHQVKAGEAQLGEAGRQEPQLNHAIWMTTAHLAIRQSGRMAVSGRERGTVLPAQTPEAAGKVVAITGAGRGIGAATARRRAPRAGGRSAGRARGLGRAARPDRCRLTGRRLLPARGSVNGG
jgi:hypothetical protein